MLRERLRSLRRGQEQQRWPGPSRAPSSALLRLQQPRLQPESRRRFRRSRGKAGGRGAAGLGHRDTEPVGAPTGATPHVLLPFLPILQEGALFLHREPTLPVQPLPSSEGIEDESGSQLQTGWGSPRDSPQRAPWGLFKHLVRTNWLHSSSQRWISPRLLGTALMNRGTAASGRPWREIRARTYGGSLCGVD